MTPLALARATRARLADPRRWTSKAYARDKDGRSVAIMSPQAVCWCYSGALTLEAALGIADPQAQRDTLLEVYNAMRAITGTGAIGVNDGRGHAGVLAGLDAVIDRLIGDI